MTQRAVVLLSGGLDSATALAVARAQGFESYALSFRYGQRHAVELDCARTLAAALGAARARDRRHRPAPVRRLGADRRHRGAQGA